MIAVIAGTTAGVVAAALRGTAMGQSQSVTRAAIAGIVRTAAIGGDDVRWVLLIPAVIAGRDGTADPGNEKNQSDKSICGTHGDPSSTRKRRP
ncbi:MAG: hypothetical protein OQK79_07950 [Rhodanobacter sp.]|nr:hypothetical protein [Rhodanobacter sp.]